MICLWSVTYLTVTNTLNPQLSWRSCCGHPLFYSSYLQAQANLPYVDDSEAVSPTSEENNVHGCLADSLSGMATVAGQIGSHPGCLGRVHWLGSVDHDSFRSRQNSYCSHASRWSYTSHSLRSASRLAGGGFGPGSDECPSGTGTRSCRNSLLIPPELCVITDSDKSRVEFNHVSYKTLQKLCKGTIKAMSCLLPQLLNFARLIITIRLKGVWRLHNFILSHRTSVDDIIFDISTAHKNWQRMQN